MKIIVHSYYGYPTEGLIVSLKGDLEGMFSLPSLGHHIQHLFENGHDISVLIDIYDQMRSMNRYGLPDMNDYYYGKTMHPETIDQNTPDLFKISHG